MVEVVLNLLVLDDLVKKGSKQSNLLRIASDLGFSFVEIRREYFQDIDNEIVDISSIANDLHLRLFYSVPANMFVDGNLNPELVNYLEEAKKMGIVSIKWNIGDFDENKVDIDALRKLTTYGIQITVENDQTILSGSSTAIQKFLQFVEKHQLDIGYVYDMGNWRYIGEHEENGAQQLAKYCRYIHVKNVDRNEKNQLTTIDLDKGLIDWQNILNILPANVPVAIEYPIAEHGEIQRVKKLLEDYYEKR